MTGDPQPTMRAKNKPKLLPPSKVRKKPRSSLGHLDLILPTPSAESVPPPVSPGSCCIATSKPVFLLSEPISHQYLFLIIINLCALLHSIRLRTELPHFMAFRYVHIS